MTPRLAWRRALLAAALTVPAVLPAAAPAATLWPATVTTANTGMWPSLVIPADGRPLISHYDGANGWLLVTRCDDRACQGGDEDVSVLDNTAQTGRESAMALSGGTPVVAHQYLTANDLRVGRCDDLACSGGGDTAGTLDSGSWVIGNVSMAVPADGFPVIAYFDATANDLKVMKCNDAACAGSDETVTTVYTTDVAGFGNAIGIGQDGRPVIAFSVLNAGSADLFFMRCNDAACAGGDETVMPVATAGDAGDAPAMVVPPDGRPIISYYADDTDDLRVVRCTDAFCTPAGGPPAAADTTGDVGDHSAITVNAAGNPVISYHDTTNGDLRLLECNDPACATGGDTMTVVDADNAGATSAIAMDAHDRPVIAYRSDGVDGLRVAASDPAATAPAGAVDLGSVDADSGGAVAATLTVTSSGSTPITFGTPTVTGADGAVFTVTGGTCAGGTVAPGASCTVTLAFDPVEVGTVTDTLTLPSDDPAGSLTRTVTGEGTFTGTPPTDPGFTPPAPGPAPTSPTAPSAPVAAPRLTSVTAAKGVLTVRATDTTSAALVVAARRPAGPALTRALAACAKRKGTARTRCTDTARWKTLRRGTVTFTAGAATFRLGKLRGAHRVSVTLTGPGGTATATRTLRLR